MRKFGNWFIDQPWEVKVLLIGFPLHLAIALILEPQAFVPTRPAPWPWAEAILKLLGL